MSIWTPGRIPNVGNRHALGVWLNYRKVASGVQIPNQKNRRQLYGKLANWYVIYSNPSLASQASDRGSFTAKGNLKIVALLGSYVDLPAGDAPASNAGYQVQFFDAGAQQLWSAQAVLWNLHLGSAKQPFWLRSPYALKPNAPLTVTIQSLSPNASDVQVTLFGYQD